MVANCIHCQYMLHSLLDMEIIYWAPCTECAMPLKWRGNSKGLDLMKKQNEVDEITIYLRYYVCVMFF